MATMLSPYLFEAAPDGLVVVDHTGAIVLVNGQIEALFGYHRQDLLGQAVEVLIPEALRPGHVHHRKEFSHTPHARPMGAQLALFGRRQDGTQFPVEISLSPISMNERLLVMAIIRDVTARKQLESALQASMRAAQSHLRLLQTILDQLPSGVYLARGEDAKLVLANRAATTLWGAAWSEGKPMAEFLAECRVQFQEPSGQPYPFERIPSIQALRGRQEIVQAQVRIVRPDGVTVPVLVTSVPLPASLFLDGATTQERMALAVYQDVTVMAEAERIKDEFVALAAHELRTPIAVASGYAQMLLRPTPSYDQTPPETPLAPWQDEALGDIDSALKRLTALTDDLLDVTRLQAGRLLLSKEPHDLVALASRLCKRMQTTTTQHVIRLEAHARHLIVEIDVRRIEQVFHNLLSNAIKYSPLGGEIAIAMRKVGPDPAHGIERPSAEITIQDHGMGIPADQQAMIFERFVRARNAQERGIDGTGLGLYLCKEILAAHDGHIWFESAEGQGTTFHVLLPLLPLSELE
ncbi:MAG TPA: ATP-binding protein [Ktedonobacterales bacterium]